MPSSPGYRDVLFVCHANTSRSVIAVHVLCRLLAEAGRADIRVRSGGIAPYARDGMLVSMDARLILEEIGIVIPSDSTATDLKVQRHLLAESDLILVMTDEQRRMLVEYPEARGKPVFTLPEFAGEAGNVEDPAGQGEDVFRVCRNEIDRCLTKALPRFIGTERVPVPRWQSLSAETVYDCRPFSVVRRRSRSPHAPDVHDFFVLEAPEWVNIIPLTEDEQVVMVHQYRHGVADVTLEVPGGMVDATDPKPRVAARREMLEETGYDSDSVEPLGVCHPNPAIQSNRCHTFVARNVTRRQAPLRGSTEYTEPVIVPLAKIPELIQSGVITHGLVIVAFHLLGLSDPSTLRQAQGSG